MESLLGSSYSVFFGMTVIIMGFGACVTGQALANSWRPASQVFIYAVLLGFADRFLTFALFQGELLSLSGYLIDTVALIAISGVTFRVTKARKLVSQFPWLYEADGVFGWREKGAGGK